MTTGGVLDCLSYIRNTYHDELLRIRALPSTVQGWETIGPNFVDLQRLLSPTPTSPAVPPHNPLLRRRMIRFRSRIM